MENWPLVKRMKLAKKRRRDQLRKWREGEDASEDEVHHEQAGVGRRLRFEPSVALLESATRNDTAEGEKAMAWIVCVCRSRLDAMTEFDHFL